MIPISKPWITGKEKKYVQEAMDSGWISSGPFLDKFEETFASKIDMKYALATNSGTSACHLAIASLGFRPNDEIIIPSTTFVATANAVRYSGCQVSLADIDPLTWNIDLNKTEELIRERTVGIFLVHLYGNMCNIKEVKSLCIKNNIFLIEDACEALGGSFEGKPAGSFGKTSAFSFYGNKTITTGEGGMFLTNDKEIYNRAKMFRGQGQTNRYYHPIIGNNYRMTNIQAALGLAQLERLEEILTEKRRVFDIYKRRLSNTVGWQKETGKHSSWAITITVPDPLKISCKLLEKDIETRPVFYPIGLLPPYKESLGAKSCKNSETLYKHGITLPSFAELKNEEIDLICNEIFKNL